MTALLPTDVAQEGASDVGGPGAHPEQDDPPRVVCVARRVDYFTYAAKVKVAPAVWARLDELRAEAERLHHPVPVDLAELGGLVGEPMREVLHDATARLALSHRAKGEVFSLQNADVQVTLWRSAPADWSVEVRPLANFLARHTFRDAIALARKVAKCFGELRVGFPGEERCRRLDLAADFANWRIRREDNAAFVKRQRAALADFFAERDDDDAGARYERPETQTYRHDEEPTGIAVCPGGRVMARVYDKRKELAIRNSPDKTEMEETLWRANGWDGKAPITRVEVQVRTEALKEMKIQTVRREPGDDAAAVVERTTLCDDLDALASNLDAIWAYFTTKWLTLRIPGDDTRLHRCALDERWKVAQRVTWHLRSPPIARRRKKGGATTAQSLGCILSTLASAGLLPFAGGRDGYPVDPDASALEDWSAERCAIWVRRELGAIVGAFADYAERDLMSHTDDAKAVVRSLVLRRQAVASRFSELLGTYFDSG